jgi:hypothetical protein
MIATTSPGDALRKKARETDEQVKFLLEEYKAMTDSLLRNEESGEKRAAFFMTLAGAAGGIVAFVFNRQQPDRQAVVDLEAVAAGVAALLLILGLMTTRRLAERHKQTDHFIFALRQIRRTFISPEDAARIPNAFAEAFESRQQRKSWSIGIRKGGWLECVAAVNAVLAGVCAACLFAAMDVAWLRWLTLSFLCASGTWILQIHWSASYIANGVKVVREMDEEDRRSQGTAQWTKETRKQRYVGTPSNLGAGAAVVVGRGMEGGAGGAPAARA